MNRLVKKLIGWTLCAVLLVGMLPIATRGAKAADTGAGASEGIVWNAVENCYEISNYAGLLEFARIVNEEGKTNANAILMNEISAEESSQSNTWTPIGTFYDNRYIGTFDGKGYTIKGLTIESTGNYIGLFGYVGQSGSVKNVTLEGGSIKGSNYVGGVAGKTDGTVSSCYNTGAVSGTNYVGGVVGYNNEGCTVSDCYNTGAVSGTNYVGGVVGRNYGTVSDCYNTGAVSGSGEFVGGVAGYNNRGGTVSDCYNTGAVSGSGEFVGGVAGRTDGTVSDCYNTGRVEGRNGCVGGVTGWNNLETVSNCYNTGAVTGNGEDVGGLVGCNYGTVSDCYNTGDVSGISDHVGGLVGYIGGTVSNCYNTGGVEGRKGYVGGVVGYISSGTVSNCYSTGAVSGSGENVGGVVGWNYGRGEVSNCYYNKSICQTGAINGSDNEDNKVMGLATLQMIGASSELHDSLESITDDKGNHVWLFKTNSDGTYYYPHLAGFNFDKFGNQLAANKIPVEEWPNKGTFSVTLSEDRFTYNGGMCEIKKVTLDEEVITGYKVVYLDKDGSEVQPIKVGEYYARVYWKDSKKFGFEKTFKILPASVTLTADSASTKCDGIALTKDSYTCEGLAAGDTVKSVTITGSQTGPGSSENVPSAVTIVNAKGEDVTNCYDITYVNGKLTVSEHSFEQEVADAKYQKSEADCIHAAVYYKSCKCGEKGTETFESGEPLGHDYKAVEGSAVAPTCEKAGKEADQKCERCGDVITGKEIPATGHTWKAATGYAPKTCEICGATEGDVIKYTVEGGNTIEFTQGDQKNIIKTYHRSEDDKHAIDHHKGVQIDGKDVQVDAKSGSVILTFDAATLNALGVGDHVITVIFDDWIDELKLVIKAPVSAAVDPAPTTGDSSLPFLWVTLLLLSMAGTSVVVMRRRKRA